MATIEVNGALDGSPVRARRTPRSFQDMVGRLRHVRPGERLDGIPAAVAPDVRVGTTERQLAGFDLHSVASVATRFAGYVIAIVMCAVVVFWLLGSIFGVVGAFEEFMQGIGFTGFRLLSIPLLFGLAFVAVVIGVAVVGMTVVAAALYNVLANQHGGVRVFLSGGSVDEAHTDGTSVVHTNGDGPNGNGDEVVHNHGIGFAGLSNDDDALKPVIGVGQAPIRMRRAAPRIKRRRPQNGSIAAR